MTAYKSIAVLPGGAEVFQKSRNGQPCGFRIRTPARNGYSGFSERHTGNAEDPEVAQALRIQKSSPDRPLPKARPW